MRQLFFLLSIIGISHYGFSQNWQLVWADEFNGNTLDSTNWVYDYGTGSQFGLNGWGNNELEYYTDREENVKVENGNLSIIARDEDYQGMNYTSGRIKTKGLQYWTYGKIEARIKLPIGQGIWPAFWMLRENDVVDPQANFGWPGEIDIMEIVGHQPARTYGTCHFGRPGAVLSNGGNTDLASGTFADEYHLFTIEWYPDNIIWYLDGQEFHRVSRLDIHPNYWLFAQNYHLLLNVAVGGLWPGSPDASTQFPVQMDVDYIRIYDYDSATTSNVSFTVDMSSEELLPSDIVYVNGNFNNWCGTCNPMTHLGNGIWQADIALSPGLIEYKFTTNGWNGLIEEFDPGTSCALTTDTGNEIYVNRVNNIGFEDLTLDQVCFNSCLTCQLEEMGCMNPTAVNYDPTALVDDGSCLYQVDFSVDMNEVGFAYTTPEINGSFNGWCGACETMVDPDTDGVWNHSILLPEGLHEFKFATDFWTEQEQFAPGTSCTLTTGEFTNRQITVSGPVTYGPVCWESCEDCPTDCPDFETAPVDLTKSFDPVGGVSDRVQLKWYKASPTVRYTDGDAAACDIKFWAKRNLDPLSGNPVGGAIQNPDTTTILNALKSYPDSSPKSIFKWPVKFKALGANNNKRVDPNIRYEWKVRCACEHGAGNESPWSEVKIFNTPDFDPNTGLANIIDIETRGTTYYSSKDSPEVVLYPNPSNGASLNVSINNLREDEVQIEIRNLTSEVVYSGSFHGVESYAEIVLELDNPLSQGTYVLILSTKSERLVRPMLVQF